MKHLLCVLSACLVWFLVDVSATQTKKISTFHATERLAEHLNRGAFTTVVQNVAGTVSPYFSIFSSVIKLIVGIGSATTTSAELEYLHELTNSINQKFDEVNSEFEEVKKLIKWTSVQTTYAVFERNIRAVFDNFQLIFNVSSSAMHHQKQMFLDSYQQTYQDSGFKLYEGFIFNYTVFGEGFLRPAMTHTGNDRRHMRTIMMGVVKLLLMAANVELGYQAIKGYDTIIPVYSQRWQVRFIKVQEKMNETDKELKDIYLTQAKIDIDTFSKNNTNLELSNPMFSRFLYQELSKKYFWRDWLVVVSTHTDYDHDAQSRICNGVIKSTHRIKDLVIDSVEKEKAPLNIHDVTLLCSSLQQTCKNTVTSSFTPCNYYYPVGKRQRPRRCGEIIHHSENADVVFKWITYGNSCSPYSSYGVINTGKKPVHYVGPTDDSPNRLFVCDLGVCNYYVHFFG